MTDITQQHMEARSYILRASMPLATSAADELDARALRVTRARARVVTEALRSALRSLSRADGESVRQLKSSSSY